MPAFNQTKALEAAAQRLAAHAGHDYSAERMVDHYLRRARRADPVIRDLVAEADAIVRPLLDTITDLEAEGDLLQHRLRQCHTEGRNLADYVRALANRLPSHLEAHWPSGELRAWLIAEAAKAPYPPYSAAPKEARP
ncbi:hypothetical protein SAMN05216600_12854 [Pseudomonas cuatrocienegasensis]|uniref:Uncharacterized protein n=1 Tax=Pseudomonas cuatrocienegasensis TaxID=543360 RepID=A0ABY1BR15_9PSED|nr:MULTISPECIES: hypothetical protein [Pseudomonas]OEC32901.1 hypothetical protein A7D25_21905 [Pseudomonas sp. 21C1]SER41919.1 hypothetical protein SAMN05216600_12854 [Pseudomonas cuatrocienegasensis]